MVVSDAGGTADVYHRVAEVGVGTNTCAEVSSAFATAWAASPWSPYEGSWRIYVADATEGTSECHGGFASHRWKGKPALTSIPTMCPSAACVYIYPTTHRTFADMDNLGFVEGRYNLVDELTESSASSRTAMEIGDIQASAVSAMGYSCPIDDNHSCIVDGSYWLLKWSFTNYD